MLLFRSEEHLETWRTERGIEPGATMTAAQQWEVSRDWYQNRLAPDWRRPTPSEAQAVLAAAGLHGDFWALS